MDSRGNIIHIDDDEVERMAIEAGATRIGASAGVKIVQGDARKMA